jgi:preprotein translocase subunit SecE
MVLISPERGFLVKKSKNYMKFANYIRDTRAEIKHVNWPTRAQAIGYTVVVILFSAFIAVLLGAFDYIFSQILAKLIS